MIFVFTTTSELLCGAPSLLSNEYLDLFHCELRRLELYIDRKSKTRNEDRWTDVALAARLVRALSESTGARKLVASIVGRIGLAAVA
jgi:hypothetical protein